jgi:hypothetical protein
MKQRTMGPFLAAALVAAGFLGILGPTAHAKEEPILTLSCVLQNMNVGNQSTMDIVIERWSEPTELTALKTVLVEKGTDKLLSTLQDIKPRAGFLRKPMTVGWDIHYAAQSDLPGGGKKVVFVTDRPMRFWGVAMGSDSAEYEFTLAEIRLDKDNATVGEGKLVTAAQVLYNEKTKTIEIANYANEPVRLSQVKVDEPKQKKGRK